MNNDGCKPRWLLPAELTDRVVNTDVQCMVTTCEMADVLVQAGGGTFQSECGGDPGLWGAWDRAAPGMGCTGPGAEAALSTALLIQNAGEQV